MFTYSYNTTFIYIYNTVLYLFIYIRRIKVVGGDKSISMKSKTLSTANTSIHKSNVNKKHSPNV